MVQKWHAVALSVHSLSNCIGPEGLLKVALSIILQAQWYPVLSLSAAITALDLPTPRVSLTIKMSNVRVRLGRGRIAEGYG